MKFLALFAYFDWLKFAAGKKFVVIGCSEWLDYKTKQHSGTKVEVVIADDKTVYKSANGSTESNLYEKLTFKVGKDVNIPQKTIVEPVNVTATVYGEYRNQLSIRCDDIKVLSQAQKPNALHQ